MNTWSLQIALLAKSSGANRPADREILPERSSRSMAVIGTDLKTGKEVRYASLREAERKGEFRQSCITKCLQGKLKAHKGWAWRKEGE